MKIVSFYRQKRIPMKVIHYEQVSPAAVQVEGASGCTIRCLISPEDAAPSFSMRYFEVAPGGHTPHHTHGYEHEVYVLEGSGVILEGTVEHPLRPGTAILVAPNELHQFRNTGATTLKFLCFIPHPLRGMSEPCPAACSCN
jgi:quercetin dioxygenase-like cupin family protein